MQPLPYPCSRIVAALVVAGAMAGCGDDSGAHAPRDHARNDGGLGRDGGAGGTGNDGVGGAGDGSNANGTPEPSPDAKALRCGGDRCADTPASLAPLGAAPCCTDDDRCGVETLLAPGVCLAAGAPGGAEPSCPSFTIAGSSTWAGCCTAQGECGALDLDGGLGCVANGNLMSVEQSCDYDPRNTCTRITEIACDGAEDCTRGRMCCGHFDGAGYLRFSCVDSCAKREARTGEIWSEACHPGDTCETAGFECLANPGYLPDSLYRCRDSGTTPRNAGSTTKGEINCGSDVCGSGQKCCVSSPGLVAHCAPADVPCPCDLGAGPDIDGGTDDAG